jgi:hypothetical protein
MGRGARDTLFSQQLATGDFDLEVGTQPRLWTHAAVALANAKRLGAGAKMRHLDVSHFFTQQLVKDKRTRVGKVPGTANPPNCLTKHLNAAKKAASFADLGLIDMSEAHLQELVHAADKIELIGAVTERQATPWKPNCPLAANMLKMLMLQQMMMSCTSSNDDNNNNNNNNNYYYYYYYNSNNSNISTPDCPRERCGRICSC